VDEDAEKQILVIPGANRGLKVADVERASPSSLPHASCLPARGPGEIRRGRLRLGSREWRANRPRPGPAARLSRKFLKLVDVLKPNSAEAEVLTDVRVKKRSTARKAAHRLLDLGVGAVVIQAGSGNLVVWRDGEHWLPRHRVKAVDATGAGDALAGTLATYLARGRSLVEAATLANDAALKTTKLGADRAATEEDILKLLR
jgi:ribokinase